MVSKKTLVIAILATFCLTSILFMIRPTMSNPGIGEYNPWVDLNDDGTINILDAIILSNAYATSGTPINKTAVLLDLQNRVTSLENQVNFVKTLRFYTPNETMTNDTTWVDAAVFQWTPQNSTDNTILNSYCYFSYETAPNGYIQFQVMIDDSRINNIEWYLADSQGYQQTQVFHFSTDMLYIKSTYTIKLQITSIGEPPSPQYVKNINIFLNVMDGIATQLAGVTPSFSFFIFT